MNNQIRELIDEWVLENIGDAKEASRAIAIDNLLNLVDYVYEIGKRDGLKKAQDEEGAWVELHKQAVIKLSKTISQEQLEGK